MQAIAELIRERRATLGLHQSTVADWFQQWKYERNIHDELQKYEASDPDIVAEIREYVTSKRYRSEEKGSQGTVSKWERGSVPSEDKWLALAEWLDVPLRTVYGAVKTELAEPVSAEARLLALRKARADYRAACGQRDEIADMLRTQRREASKQQSKLNKQHGALKRSHAASLARLKTEHAAALTERETRLTTALARHKAELTERDARHKAELAERDVFASELEGERDELATQVLHLTDQVLTLQSTVETLTAEVTRLRQLNSNTARLQLVMEERDMYADMLADATVTNASLAEEIERLASSGSAQAGEVHRLATVVRMAQNEVAALRQRVIALCGTDLQQVPASAA